MDVPPATGPRRAERRWLYGCGAVAYLGMLGVCARRLTADGYDGVGFILALSHFDPGRWQPQPPGYPLFVLLGRVPVALGIGPALALALVNAVLLAAGLWALSWGLRRLAGATAGQLAALLLPAGPLGFALALSSLSDAAGLGALLLAALPLLRPGVPSPRRLWMGGAAVGLALGVRPAYAPLAAAVVVAMACWAGWRAAARVALAIALPSLGWLVPLAAWVGPQRLWALSLTHAQGHFADFGGSVVSDPHLARRFADLVKLCLVGAGGAVALPWVVLGGVALWARPPRLWPAAARRCAASLLGFIIVYGLWVLLALPLQGHGRHALPLTVAFLALLAVIVGTALPQSAGDDADGLLADAAPPAPRWPEVRRSAACRPPARHGGELRYALGIGSAVLLCALWGSSLHTVFGYRRSKAPGPALAEYVVAGFPRGTALYGARAARHLDAYLGTGTARPAQYLGEVIADSVREVPLPSSVLFTSEVQLPAGLAQRFPPLSRFCYAAAIPAWLRFDRFAADCVTLYAYRVAP